MVETANQPVRLTASYVRGLKPKARDFFVRDEEVKKMQLKITPAGNKSFIVRYRNSEGRERKFKLGDFPDMNTTKARKRAGEVLLRVASGEDPAGEKAQRRGEQRFAEYCSFYLKRYAEVHLRPSTQKEYSRLIARELVPRFGNHRLATIKKADVSRMMGELRNTPYQANRTLAVLKLILNSAIEDGILPFGTNPTRGVKKFKEERRERLLSEAEQTQLGEAYRELVSSNPENVSSYNAFLFLLFTGCRRTEALQLRWKEVDFDRRTVIFARTKTEPRQQYMSDQLLEFMQKLDSRNHSEYVFPSRRTDQPLKDPKRAWARMLKVAGIEGVRLHDIRHTVLTDVATTFDLPTAAIIGGHKSIQTTMRYVHGRTETTKMAVQTMGQRRLNLLSGGDLPNRETDE